MAIPPIFSVNNVQSPINTKKYFYGINIKKSKVDRKEPGTN